MNLHPLSRNFSVCKLRNASAVDLSAPFVFIGKTDQELSLVCETSRVPADALARSDGWSAFRVQGPLDFSLVGILSSLSGTLAAARIGIFAVSTYDTDYILVKSADLPRALSALRSAGHSIL